MKKYYFIFILFFISCSPIIINIPKKITSKFTQKYNGDIICIDNKFKIDGYYAGFHIYNDKIYESHPIIFYNDKSVIFNFNKNFIHDKRYIKNFASYGTYNINDSLLNVQIIHHDFNISYFTELEFIIVNDTTLWLNYSKGLNYIYYNDSTKNDYITKLKFYKLENKPDSNFWVKKKSWFWADKVKYKEYKKNLKSNYK